MKIVVESGNTDCNFRSKDGRLGLQINNWNMSDNFEHFGTSPLHKYTKINCLKTCLKVILTGRLNIAFQSENNVLNIDIKRWTKKLVWRTVLDSIYDNNTIIFYCVLSVALIWLNLSNSLLMHYMFFVFCIMFVLCMKFS